MSAKPTDDTIALVAFLLDPGYRYAEEIASGIARLGFERPSSQWVSGRLTAMCREECPRFVRRKPWRDEVWTYRMTSWAHTALSNQWRGFRSAPTAAELPTPKPEDRP